MGVSEFPLDFDLYDEVDVWPGNVKLLVLALRVDGRSSS